MGRIADDERKMTTAQEMRPIEQQMSHLDAVTNGIETELDVLSKRLEVVLYPIQAKATEESPSVKHEPVSPHAEYLLNVASRLGVVAARLRNLVDRLELP